MADDIVYDEILGELRMGDVSGGTGGSSSYVGGNGITLAGGTVTATVAAVDGNRIILSGGTATFNPVADIVTVTGASVTLNPDTAYKIYATSQAITLNANPPAAGKWAYDGHLEIFVANTGYVVTGANVVLANALEPDTVNNCTLRFHDGKCIISVEDHIAGYIVTVASGSTVGSLPYALHDISDEYIAFDASLNGTTVDLAGATANGEKHIVGNGYAETTLTGAVDCGSSSFTVANLSLQNVVVSGGIMTLGDAFIPSGSTVAVNGGGLAVEKVNADGGTIDLGGTRSVNSSPFDITSCTITNGGSDSVSELGAIQLTTVNSRFATISGCLISGNITKGIEIYGGGNMNIVSCVFSGNMASYGAAFALQRTHNINSYVNFKGCTIKDNTATNTVFISNNNPTGFSETSFEDCTIAENQNIRAVDALDKLVFKGSNTLKGTVTGSGTVTLTSGAIVDLTGNMNATPINPGGSITFEAGGATVYPSAGSSNAAIIGGVTVATLSNSSVLTISSTNLPTDAYFENCTLTSTNSSIYYVLYGSRKMTLKNVTLDTKIYMDSAYGSGGIVEISGTFISTSNGYIGVVTSNSSVVNINAGAVLTLGQSIVVASIVIEGDITVGGVTVRAGTYTKINPDGTTE